MIIFILIILGLYYARVIVSHILTWRYIDQSKKKNSIDTPNPFYPALSIIKPVKGLDENAYENFKSFCEQDYPNKCEFLFCVEEESDPAVPVIKKIIKNFPGKDITLIHSNNSIKATGKLKNMITGVNHSKYDILIFSDADINAPPSFLCQVVQPLKNENIGLSFSPPVYQGAENISAALLNSNVNNYIINYALYMAVWELDSANGANMVVRKKVIDKAGGLSQFNTSIADDIELANKIKQSGYMINFHHEPARIIHRYDSFKKYWNQVHRWCVTLKHSSPILFLVHSLSDIPGFWCLLIFIKSVPAGLALFIATVLFQCVSRYLINWNIVKDKSFRKYLWTTVIHDFINFAHIIYSYISNTVYWRGRKIRIKGRDKIDILEK